MKLLSYNTEKDAVALISPLLVACSYPVEVNPEKPIGLSIVSEKEETTGLAKPAIFLSSASKLESFMK